MRSAAPFLGTGQTTVGTAIRIEHRRATPVGATVEVMAQPPDTVDGRRLTFVVQAIDGSGRLVATGEIDRAIVDREGFLAALPDTEADPGSSGGSPQRR